MENKESGIKKGLVFKVEALLESYSICHSPCEKKVSHGRSKVNPGPRSKNRIDGNILHYTDVENHCYYPAEIEEKNAGR